GADAGREGVQRGLEVGADEEDDQSPRRRAAPLDEDLPVALVAGQRQGRAPVRAVGRRGVDPGVLAGRAAGPTAATPQREERGDQENDPGRTAHRDRPRSGGAKPSVRPGSPTREPGRTEEYESSAR